MAALSQNFNIQIAVKQKMAVLILAINILLAGKPPHRHAFQELLYFPQVRINSQSIIHEEDNEDNVSESIR
jgi:hypothetical protein